MTNHKIQINSNDQNPKFKTITKHLLDLNRKKSSCGYGKSHFPTLIYPDKLILTNALEYPNIPVLISSLSARKEKRIKGHIIAWIFLL